MRTKLVFGVATAVALASQAVSLAAPATYQTAVLAGNPFAFFRQQETGIGTGATADSLDTPGNRDATYQGSPVGGVLGASAGSDNAVTYAGQTVNPTTFADVAATQYFGGANLRPFGTSLGTSTYEFVFKVDSTTFATNQRQSLFGVFNTGSTTAAEVTLNSQGNDAIDNNGALAGNQGLPNSTRLFIRGDNGAAVGGAFTNASLFDGNYHHLVFSFNAAGATFIPAIPDPDGAGPLVGTPAAVTGGFIAYVDGVPQVVTNQIVGGSAVPGTFNAFTFDPTFAARNVRSTLGGAAVTRQFNGTLDEAVLYGSVLTPAQVAANFAATGIIVPEPAALSVLALGALVGRRRRNV